MVIVYLSVSTPHPHPHAKAQTLRPGRIFYKCFLLRSTRGFCFIEAECIIIIIPKGTKLLDATALVGCAMACPGRGGPGATKLASGDFMCKGAK